MIDAVSRQWTLRFGTETETCLFNLRTGPADEPAPIEGVVGPKPLGKRGAYSSRPPDRSMS